LKNTLKKLSSKKGTLKNTLKKITSIKVTSKDDSKKSKVSEVVSKNTFYYLDVIRELPAFYKIETDLSLKQLQSFLRKEAKKEATNLNVNESYFYNGECENPDYFTFDVSMNKSILKFSISTFLSKTRSETRLTNKLDFIETKINKKDLK
jgi:hypothetical protein